MLPGASSFDHEARQLNTGIVKWFNATKGYGFIQPESGEADAFVHISAVERAGVRGLNEGQRVKYELVRGRNGKSSAENLIGKSPLATLRGLFFWSGGRSAMRARQ